MMLLYIKECKSYCGKMLEAMNHKGKSLKNLEDTSTAAEKSMTEEIKNSKDENIRLLLKLLETQNEQNIKLAKMEKQLLEMQNEKNSNTERVSSDTNLQKDEMCRFKSEVEETIRDKVSDLKEKIIRCEEMIVPLVDKKFTAHTKTTDVLDTETREFEWTIFGIRKILKDWKRGHFREIFSLPFVSNEFAYKLQCKLEYQSVDITFSIKLKCEPIYPQSLSAIYLHQRTFTIVNQSYDGTSNIQRIATPLFGNQQAQAWMTGFHNDTWPIKVDLIGKKYIKNDSIVVRILIEPLAIVYKSVFSKNGTATWKLNGYHQKKQDYLIGVDKFLKSPYFYTSERGYRVHLGLHIRSLDAWIYLTFDKGEFDDFLPATFPHKTTITIMDQSGSEPALLNNRIFSLESTETTMNLMAKIPLEELENNKYLKNDTIFIKVTVEEQ